MPKVSVVMSVCNSEPFIRDAIKSILGQTFQDFEFIIINDGSTDGSLQIIQSYGDSRIRITSQENLGLTKSLNKGIGIARGEYIARQDADDISEPSRLEKQVAVLEEKTAELYWSPQTYGIFPKHGLHRQNRIVISTPLWQA